MKMFSGEKGTWIDLKKKIGEGKGFMATREEAENPAAAANILITVGTTPAKLFSCVLGSEDTGAIVALYEAPTAVTVVGTGVIEYNLNMTKAAAPGNTVTVTHTPTIATDGTLMLLDQVTLGEIDLCDEGFISLKPSTVYNVKLTNITNSERTWVHLKWIEG